MSVQNGKLETELTNNEHAAYYDEPVQVIEAAQEAIEKIAPVWDLHNYVAVNPFFSLRNMKFLPAMQLLQAATHSPLFPRRQYFKEQYESGVIQNADVTFAIEEIRINEQSGTQIDLYHNAIIASLDKERAPQQERFWCFSDHYDEQHASNLTDVLTHETSKWIAAYFDEGQALVPLPYRDEKFYTAWRRLAKYDRTLELQGVQTKNLINELPFDPERALQELVAEVSAEVHMTQEHWVNYFHRILCTSIGWVSYAQHIAFENSRAGQTKSIEKARNKNIALEILVMRMAYDVAVFRKLSDRSTISSRLELTDSVTDDNLVDYIWLLALERSYRKKIIDQMKPSPTQTEQLSTERPSSQLVFCIDVRSEVIRRHIELTDDSIQTIGFAGFFGLPVSVESLGEHNQSQQCPVLLEPQFHIHEETDNHEHVVEKAKSKILDNMMHRNVRASLNSCYSVVETLWPSSLVKMISSTLFGKNQTYRINQFINKSLKDQHRTYDLSCWSQEQKTDIAYAALKNMSMTKEIAPVVVFFGHEGESVNNPHAGALDCGACCGHSGMSNARILAQLLNDKQTKSDLKKQKGIFIPKDSTFFAGIHNTTKGTLTIEASDDLSPLTKPLLIRLQKSLEQAVKEAQKELTRWLQSSQPYKPVEDQLKRRSEDWSETRPEWGLARNASFYIGRRNRTRAADLWGRCFLHDYDPFSDTDHSVLELIMTAPMVVTNWINLQYYASTVAPSIYGAGDKTLHNVVGGIGVIEGSSGDLATGLSKQSVHYQGRYFHEPLRLQVVIEAAPQTISKIIDKHQMVRELISNNWVQIVSIHPESDEVSFYESNGWLTL